MKARRSIRPLLTWLTPPAVIRLGLTNLGRGHGRLGTAFLNVRVTGSARRA